MIRKIYDLNKLHINWVGDGGTPGILAEVWP